MARTIIKKQTVTFYENDSELLKLVEEAAKINRQSFQSFVLAALEEKVGYKPKLEISNEEESKVPLKSAEALKGW